MPEEVSCMDCPITAKYQSALACFSAQNQQRIVQYLALLATRHSAAPTRAAVVSTLNALRRQVTGERHSVLTEDLTQATAHDISAFITAAQASGLAPSTINTKVGLLAGFFGDFREDGQVRQQPCVRRRRRVLIPQGPPQPSA